MILALETSCDETCAAVMTPAGELLSNVISSQLDHARFGGVVPEIAARHHLELINGVVDKALGDADIELDQVNTIAVTQGPGLVGALLIGLASAKAFAAPRRLPLVPVDHLYGHIASNFVDGPPQFPFICLIASGGHTLLLRVTAPTEFELLGSTLDDAAGEAFDKGARLLGFPYPGGAALSQCATQGDPASFNFPTASRVKGLDFSFAGLKTALLYKVRELGPNEAERRRNGLAAAYEEAIVETIALRVKRALAIYPNDSIAICGGVAANARLRERIKGMASVVSIPALELCTDNAAMIAAGSRYIEPLSYPDYLQLEVYSTSELRQRRI